MVSARTLLEKDDQKMWSVGVHKVHCNFCLNLLISINSNIMPESLIFVALSSKIQSCCPKCGHHCEICQQLNINENSEKEPPSFSSSWQPRWQPSWYTSNYVARRVTLSAGMMLFWETALPRCQFWSLSHVCWDCTNRWICMSTGEDVARRQGCSPSEWSSLQLRCLQAQAISSVVSAHMP